MELELGLKITKIKDDTDSISEYQFMKDAGPVFHSRETNTMFILIANLKGYKKNNIDIKISKDGSKISIIGKKPIQEMVMMGWVMQRKVVDVKGFNKVFKIPHGVNLDKIKANYNEEEWMMNIVMPKLVKGICGLKIEEFKEQEKSEIDHVSSSVGETRQKGSKDCEFQDMEGSENDTNKITTQKEVRGSKLTFEDGNDEVNRNIRENEKCKLRIEDSKIKDTRKHGGKETYEALKTLENMEKMLNETKKDVNEEAIEKEVGDTKLRIENENGEIAREKDGKEEYDVTKKSERDQGVGVFISNKFEDMSKDKEIEDQKIDSRNVIKRHDDVNRDIIGGTIKEEEKEISNLRSEDGKVKDIGKCILGNNVDTNQRVFEESMIQQSEESKQKESKEHFEESEKENNTKPFEAIKVLEVEHNVVGGCIDKNEFEESRIPQMEKTKSTKGKIIGGEYEKLPFKANQDFQKEMIKAKMKTKDGDQKWVLEKLGGREEFDYGMVIIKKEFPKKLPRSSLKESGGSNVESMQETKNVKEEMMNKEVECFMEKGEGEKIEMMHVKQKKGNNTRETMQEEIEEGRKGIKGSCQEQFSGIKGNKEFDFENKDEQKQVIKKELVEKECLIVEGGEYEEITKEIVQDEEDKNKHGIVKLKGEGCTKIHGEPNKPFDAENANIGTFDGRKTQKLKEIEQTKDEDVNEEGENIQKYMKKVVRDKYEKVKNEENEGFDQNKTEKKDERFSQEETSKGISKASNASKEVFPNKMLDSLVDTRDEPKNTRIEKTKGIKESNTELFEAMNVSKLEPFEANVDDHKNFIKPKRETKNDEPKGKKPNKEGLDAKINIDEEFPKNIPTSNHEESEGLNDLKMQETKDVKEYVVNRKGKEIEYFREKGEGDRLKMMDVEAKKVSNNEGTMQEEIEKIENGIKGGGQQQAAKIEGSKGFNVEKEEEEDESKKISRSKEQDKESISHNIVDSDQRVFEEALIQQNGESKQKENGGPKCNSKERLKEVLKESSMEQNELREPRVPQMEKAKSTKERKKGGMDSEKTPFELNDVYKVVFRDAIQKEVIKINQELPKSSFDENEGLNVQKIQESKNVKEEMVDKEIEYFEEKGESERFKRTHVKTKKGNTKETMHEEIEKNENEFKESDQQHVKDNIIKEMNEVSKNVTKELKQKVGKIDESREFNDANEEEQIEVSKKSMVESESLMKKVEEKESKERTKAKIVQYEDDKIEFGIVKLKGEGPRKIHADGRSFQEKEESKNVNEKGENPEKFGNKVNNKIQNQEDEEDLDFKKGVTKKKDEGYLRNDVSERRSQDIKDAQEDFPMKMLDSQIDTREELKDRMIEKAKGLKENVKVVPFVKKVKFEEEEFKKRTKAIVQDEEDKIEYGIVKLKGEGSTNITHKSQDKEEIEDVNEKEFVKKVNEKIQNQEDEGFKKNTTKEKDDCFLQETSKERSKTSKAANEPFDVRTKIEIRNQKLESIDELIEKENVGIGIVDGRQTQKFQEMKKTQDAKNEKTKKKVSGNKYEKKQNEEIVGFKKKVTKEKDECYLEGEMSKGISKESMDEKDDIFPMMLDSAADSEEGLTDRKIEKTKGVKEESEKVEQMEANEGLRNDTEEPNFGESMTMEELQELRNLEREFQSVVSMGFKEFDFENAKDKKQKTKVLDTKFADTTFESKETYESRDESVNQEVFSPKKPKEEGENRTCNIVGETFQEKTDESEKKIDDREQENAARDDAKVEAKEKDMFKECKTTQNVDDEKCKIDDEIEKSGIEKDDKKKRIHETMKTAPEKEHSVKFEVGEKEEEESFDERLKNDIAEMKTNRDYDQHEYGAEEIKAPKTTTYEEPKTSKLQRKRINQQSKERKEAHEVTRSPKMNNEIPKEEERNTNVPESTISKEEQTQITTTHLKEKVAQQSKVPNSLSTQQLEVEGEEKTKKNELEQCINKDEEEKHEIEEIDEEEKDYEQVHEEQKQGEEKKNNAKISKKLLVPLAIAGSALLATIVFIFVKHRRSRKM
ncbi:unnamed protein product [Lathyrus sativus]|nr:unnamed protein product [Lathyrus sativus]